ncbi:hypothetical protein D9619_013649 [Psilocybe cf. subviscida]|uniref:CCHC-type domain-containing protein n=1 Tax=Psilocybe cf. subviscida TaxID=2480587 RepID=A0A8H5F9F0_9AGAR|nr:hypothetical protein D9619_013649 [Psilocybe cf. subviscida]
MCLRVSVQQVMGPDDANSNMASSSNLKVVNLPKLNEDGSNWVTYKARIKNHLAANGLSRHLNGTARKPPAIREEKGKFFLGAATKELDEDAQDAALDKLDAYDQKQAQVREAIYETVTKSAFLEIKGQATAAAVWTKLTEMHEKKGTMTYTDTLSKLANSRYVDGENMRSHISSMQELKEKLAEMGTAIPANQFTAYIEASLTPDYRPLLTSLRASAKMTGKSLSVHDLITFVYEEADNKDAQKNSDESKENAALAASHRESKGNGKQHDRGGGKSKSDRTSKKCTNCDKTGHEKPDCFSEGGGKEHEAPDWWKDIQKARGKGKATAAHAAAYEEQDDDDDDEYSFLAYSVNVAGHTLRDEGTSEKASSSKFTTWESLVWGNAKPAPRTVEAHSVGHNDEPKSHCTYHQTEGKTITDCDAYFNKNDTRLPETARPEGESGTQIMPEQIEPISASSKPTATPKTSPGSTDSALSNEPARVPTRASNPENESNRPDPPPSTLKSTPPLPSQYPHEDAPNQDNQNGDNVQEGRPQCVKQPAGSHNDNYRPKRGEGDALVANMDGPAPGDLLAAEFHKNLADDALAAGGDDSPTADEALRGNTKIQREKATQEAPDYVNKCQTLEIVEVLRDPNITDGRHTLRRKRDNDGEYIRHKAQHVAAGFKQQYPVNYGKTFAPGTRTSTLNAIVTVATQRDAYVTQHRPLSWSTTHLTDPNDAG